MKIKKLISKFLVAAMLISAVPMNSIAEGELVYFENQENAESAYDGAGEWAEALTDDVVVIDQEAAAEKAEIPEEEGDASVVEIVEAADPEIPAAEETPAANEIPAEEGPAEEEVPAIEKAADETSVKEDAPAADKTPAVEAAPDSEKAATDEWGRTDEWAEPAGEADGLAAAEAVEGEIAEAAEGNAESMGSADGPEADNSIENAAEVSALTLAGGGNPVAQIGETTYESLGAAIAAVPENEETTITILCDIPDAVGITVDGAKEFTVDFGGHVYTVGKPGAGSAGTKTQGFQLLKDTRVTFKNGTIQVDPENKNVVWAADAREKGIAWLINNYGILCLDNMTIDGTNLAKNLQSAGGQEPANVVRYVVNNYANGVYITGNTEITAAEGDVALSANAYNAFYEKPEYSGGLSAVIESATINGKVESIGSWLDLRSGAVVNGQLRVGQNKEGAKGRSNVAIYKGATVSNPEYPVVVFGKNTLDVYGKVESTSADSRDTAAISTNGNAYNAGSVINIHDGADISSKTCSAIYLPNGSLTIDGGEITGPTAVYFKSTALSISGGTLTGNGEKAEYKYNGNGNNPTGDALVIDNCNYPTPLAESPVQVTGGRFVSENACPVGSYAGNGQETPLQKFISGGNFNAAFAEGTNLLKEGFKLELNGYGTYSVVSEEAAYQIVETEKTYQSLSAAIAEVREGQTIKLLRNVADAEGITIPENSKFTVDFDGHVYTTGCPGAGSARTRTQAFQILEGSNITFKNGTIKCSEENKDYTWSKDSENKGIAMLIQNYADLTLSYMVIDGTNIAHNGSNVRYVMSNNSGTVNIKDTQIKAPEGDFALDSCLYHTYKKPVVTIESSFARITGNIEATGGDININASVDGQVRVGQNKAGGAAGSVVTIGENAYVMRNEYPVVVFGENTLNVYGNVFSESSTSKDTAAISTNGNAYNAGSVINIYDGAQVSSETCSAIYMPNGELNISGGYITGPTAVYFKSTALSISGGTLTGNGEKAEYKYNGNGGNPTGDALVIDNCNYPSGITAPVITGGEFISEKASPVGSYAGNGQTESLTHFVSGGTFKTPIEPSADLCAEGYKFVKNAEGKYGVESTYEARIGEEKYATLAAAVAEAKDGDTIVLLSNVKLSEQLCTGTKKFTLDLNGKEISYNGTPLLKRGLIGVNNGGDLTIKDSSDPSTGAIRPGENAYGAVAMTVPGDTDTNVAKLTLESGTLEGYYYGIVGNGKRGNTSVTITGGSVVGTLEDNSVGIYNPQAGSLTVTGGTVEGAMGIYVKAGNPIEIKGGTVIGNGAKGEYTPTGDGTKNTGDALVVDNCGYPGGVPGISVTGGTFRSENGNAVASYAKTGYTPVVGFISGGTYNKEFDETLCVSGYKLERNPDGTYGVVISDPLAKIVREGADVMYPSLEAAIADAQQNEIIILIKNIEVQAQILVDKACTIDLNSKVITYAGGTELNTGVIGIKHGGDLTIIDNSASSTGAIKSGTNAYAAVAMTVSGDTDDTKPSKLTLNGGYLEGKYYGITGNGSEGRGNTAIVINGGTVKGTVADDNTGIYNPQSGSLTISGGRVEGATGIYVKAGNPIAITGGEIVGTGNYAKYKPATGSFNSTGDGLVIDSCGYPGGVPGISITGGTFTSTNASPVASYAKPSETLVTRFVTGGTFNDQINAFLLEEGYVLVKSATDDTYGVEYSPVAQIGEETYASLGDAIKAVPLYGEIMILRDVDDAVGITVNGGKNFTVDFNGKVYTVGKPGAGSQGTESQAFQLLSGSEIVFENGTIDCSAYNAVAPMTAWPIQIIIQNYATLTLDHMTIDGTNIAHYDEEYNSCLVSTNNGTTTIIGGSIITDPSRLVRDVAFDSCNYGKPYSVPTVTVDGVEIDGAVEIDGGIANVKGNTTVTGRVDIYNDGQLSVENGVFSNLIWVGDDEDHLTITGGRFAMIDAPTSASVPKYVTITGGLFKRQIMKEWGWMPDGYDCYPGTEAQYPYMVTKTKSEEAAVKTTAGVVSFYQTVEEAIETVSKGTSEYDKGATILLLKDAAIENPSGVSFMKESIFDLGGNMLTVTNSDGVGNIQIHENVTVRNGYIKASPFSVDTFAYSIFEIQKEGMTITLQNIGFKAYSPISLARNNAKLVIEDTDDSEIRSNYQVHTLAAARSNGSSIWIKSGDYDIRSWVFDKDDEHNACTVRIDGGNFIIGSWNGKGVGLPTGYRVTISAGAFNLVPDEDFVVIPEGSYVVVDNAAETYKCTVGSSKSTAEASVKAQHLVNTDLYYKNLDYAMDVAYKAEDTGRKAVKLANNFSHESKGYLVPAGVTLDLAGYTLGCDSYSSNTGAYTMDSTAGTGAINAALVTIDALNNGYMAIKDPAKGYRFFPYAMRKGNPKVPDSSKPNRIRIQYAIDIKNTTGAIDHYSDAYKLLAAGNTACGLTFVTDVAFRGKTYQFKYETTDTMKVYGTDQSENPLNTKAISAYFNVNALKTGDVFNADATVQGDTQFSYTQKYAKTF